VIAAVGRLCAVAAAITCTAGQIDHSLCEGEAEPVRWAAMPERIAG